MLKPPLYAWWAGRCREIDLCLRAGLSPASVVKWAAGRG